MLQPHTSTVTIPHPGKHLSNATHTHTYTHTHTHCLVSRKLAAMDCTILAQFQTEEGDVTGPVMELPMEITTKQMLFVLNNLLKNVCGSVCAELGGCLFSGG